MPGRNGEPVAAGPFSNTIGLGAVSRWLHIGTQLPGRKGPTRNRGKGKSGDRHTMGDARPVFDNFKAELQRPIQLVAWLGSQ